MSPIGNHQLSIEVQNHSPKMIGIKWLFSRSLLLVIFVSTNLVAEDKIPYFDKVFFAGTEKDGKKSSASSFLITKEENLYLVMTRHSAEDPDKKIAISCAGGPLKLRNILGEWRLHPEADVAVMKNPFKNAPDQEHLDHAIPFADLEAKVPPRTSKILMSGYPSGRTLRPHVMPTVKPAMVSSVETKYAYKSAPETAPRPLFYVSEPLGPGGSGSPVFLIPKDEEHTRAKVVGVISGGNNDKSRSLSVVVPIKYVIELIEQLSPSD